MPKVAVDKGFERRISGMLRYEYVLELDCGHEVEVPQSDLVKSLWPGLLLRLRVAAHRCPDAPRQETGAKALPAGAVEIDS